MNTPRVPDRLAAFVAPLALVAAFALAGCPSTSLQPISATVDVHAREEILAGRLETSRKQLADARSKLEATQHASPGEIPQHVVELDRKVAEASSSVAWNAQYLNAAGYLATAPTVGASGGGGGGGGGGRPVPPSSPELERLRAEYEQQFRALVQLQQDYSHTRQLAAAQVAIDGALNTTTASASTTTATSSTGPATETPRVNPKPPPLGPKAKPESWSGEPIFDPIPTPSSYVRIEHDLKLGEGSYREIADRLEHVLASLGYSERSYYRLRTEGFALACRLEQIDETGAPLKVPERWSIENAPMRTFSLAEYINRLFTAQPGRYRVVVFVVTPDAVTFDRKAPMSPKIASSLVSEGSVALPKSVAAAAAPTSVECYALTYEFYKKAAPDEPTFVGQGLTALEQLTRSGFFAALTPRLP